MPNKPTVSTLNANSVGILNAIRNNASMEYFQAVPAAENTTDSIRDVGKAIMAYQPRMNEFINALVNRIALVRVTSRMYTNPWAFAKKGVLNFGETIEEVFVDIANAHPFDPVDAVSTVYQRNIPNVMTMFHAMNLQTLYPVTISQQQLRQAFLSLDGVTDLIARIVNSLYSAMNYDEFIMMKYVIARLALDGCIKNNAITAVTTQATAEAAIIDMKAITNKFGFMSSDYTISGNMNFVDGDNLYVITTADFDAITDVDVLAKAFNMDRANWMGRHISVDSFGFNDGELARLDMLLEDDPQYVSTNKITTTYNNALKTITALACDVNFLQVYDVLNEFTENYNGKGLYWNEFLHAWRIYSASPFVDVVMFSSTANSVTSISLANSTGSTTISAPSSGQPDKRVQFTATVTAGQFTNKGVTWSVAKTTGQTGQTGAPTIDQNGLLTLHAGDAGKWTVTATSVADGTVTGTSNLTIS